MAHLLPSASIPVRLQGREENPTAEVRAVLSEIVTDSWQTVLFMFRRALQILCHGLDSGKVLPRVCWALKHEAVLKGDKKLTQNQY